jgi:hypothetical protein
MLRVSRCLLVGALAWLPASSAVAQDVISFEQLTIGATAGGLAAATVNPSSTPAAQYCAGILEDADVRIRVDGTAPTASVGSLVETGSVVAVSGANAIRQLSAIRTGSTSGVLALNCYAIAPPTATVALMVVPPHPGESTTGTGSEVHANSPALTSPTVTGGTLAGLFTGTAAVEGRLFARDSFDQGYFVHQDDMSAKSVTDAEVNIVHGSPLGLISYREELGKTASSWLVADGTLDIKGDNTTNDEGVEIVFGGHGTVTTEGMIIAGTSGACLSASITNTDISGTDQLLIGWRQNETFTDVANYAGYTVWNVVGVNNVDGSIVSLQEVSEATDSDDSAVNMADGEARAFKVCISTAGVPTAYYSDALDDAEATGVTYNAITMTETGSTLTAGTQLWPFLTFLAAGTDGPSPLIHWVQLEAEP